MVGEAMNLRREQSKALATTADAELARAAQLADAEDRSRLLEVALAAERLRYARELAPPAGLAPVIERGRELLERLGASSHSVS